MYRGRSTTLFVRDFDRDLRAKDLGKEFCRFGPLVRCDIPAPKPGATHSYAFVEFEHHRDAEDALYAMDDRRFYEKRITVEWARPRYRGSSPPDRQRGRSPSPRHYSNSRRRSPSPRRRSGNSPRPRRRRTPSPPPLGRDPSPVPPRADRPPPSPMHLPRASRLSDAQPSVESDGPVEIESLRAWDGPTTPPDDVPEPKRDLGRRRRIRD